MNLSFGQLLRVVCGCAAFSLCCFASAQAPPPIPPDEIPKGLEGVGIKENLGQVAPLDTPFLDENGKEVTLRGYLKPGRPIILTPVYYKCTMLCSPLLNGLVNGLNDVELSAGKEFEIVTFSFDPSEQPELAEVKKRAYLTQYTRESAKEGWHFLTGTEENIKAMCDGIGFGFQAQGDEFAHSSAIIFITPEGKIARYINNVVFEPRDLKFALIETSQGAIGSPMEKFLLYMCFNYDPLANSYTASVMKIMRLGGLVMVLVMAVGLSFLWWRGSRNSGSESGIPHAHSPQEVAS